MAEPRYSAAAMAPPPRATRVACSPLVNMVHAMLARAATAGDRHAGPRDCERATRIPRHYRCVLRRARPEGEAAYADPWCWRGGSVGALPVDRIRRAQPDTRRHRRMRRLVWRFDAACRARVDAFRRYVAADLPA